MCIENQSFTNRLDKLIGFEPNPYFAIWKIEILSTIFVYRRATIER